VSVCRVEQAERKRWGMRRERKASPAVVSAQQRVLGGAYRPKANWYGERKARMREDEGDMVTHGVSK
jgi:hypothetical protein